MCVNFKLGAKIKNLFGILMRYSDKSSKSKKNRLKAKIIDKMLGGLK
ncbi:hypothetical protein BC748_2766 [Flavobacterium dankookense]|uniref:Uncharacterized protein n=1 Tax=Flavobacterium dankookense TaxID=706186 RepID=A0A4R6Q598_9FLAO|nr:hypothetical protein BC748_2766 [Flavobacterium dankookense]